MPLRSSLVSQQSVFVAIFFLCVLSVVFSSLILHLIFPTGNVNHFFLSSNQHSNSQLVLNYLQESVNPHLVSTEYLGHQVNITKITRGADTKPLNTSTHLPLHRLLAPSSGHRSSLQLIYTKQVAFRCFCFTFISHILAVDNG